VPCRFSSRTHTGDQLGMITGVGGEGHAAGRGPAGHHRTASSGEIDAPTQHR